MLVRVSAIRQLYARARVAALAVVLVVAACNDGGLFSLNKKTSAQITLRPYFGNLSAFSLLQVDVNLIRLTVKRMPEGVVVLQMDTTVDPNATAWNLNIEVPPNSTLQVLIELISKVGNVETTVFSGITNVAVTVGPQPPPPPVPVVAGGPENLAITSVVIAPRDPNLFEGDQVTLRANVTGAQNPTIVWLSLSSSVATVDANGVVRAVAPGQAIVSAFAGPKSDNVTVTVTAIARSIEVTPATSTLTSLGSDATFTGRVIDARNNTVNGLLITWSIADATIANMVSPGVFRALRNGTTTVTATTTQNGRTITGTGTLTVGQRAATITVSPASKSFTASGETQQFTAQAKDANNNDVTGLTFTWASSNTAVATVDANGLVTAKGSGTANITATSGTASGQASVTVVQTPASITLTPAEVTFESINQTAQLRAEVKDARGNVMTNVPVTFSSTNSAIADVSATGLVTARSDGQTIVTAQAGAQRAFATINVERVVRSVRVTPEAASINSGNNQQFTAAGLDANGFVVPGQTFTWSSSNTAIATVNGTGLASGVSAGTTQINARTAGGVFGSAQLTVTGPPVGGPPFTTGNVLVLGNNSGDNSYFITKMQSRMPGITFVTQNTAAGLTQSYLAQFPVVIVYENSLWSEGVQVGNAVAQYLLNGGNVIIATFYWQNRSDGGRGGSWGNLELYDPFEAPIFEYRAASMDAASLVAHPLTAGLASVSVCCYPNGATAKPGTTVVARFTDGAPMIGFVTRNLGQRFVAVSLFPAHEAYGGVSGDFYQVFINAITWAGGGSRATVPAGVTATAPARNTTKLPVPSDGIVRGGTSGSPKSVGPSSATKINR